MSVFMNTQTSPSGKEPVGARTEQRPRFLQQANAKGDSTKKILDFLEDIRAQDADDKMAPSEFQEGSPLEILAMKWRAYIDGREKAADTRVFTRSLLASTSKRDVELVRRLDEVLASQELRKHSPKIAASASHSAPYTKPHGNAKPQEPEFHSTWSLDKREPRLVVHNHKKPWTSSSCPGKYESTDGDNAFHRVWLTDPGPRGRWNRERKKQFYDTQLKQQSLPPYDEKFCRQDSMTKYWTHLLDGGLTAGGQKEKLNYVHRGPNTGGTHFYLGKFDNVKHSQYRCKQNFKDGKKREIARDERAAFDFCLHDDMVLAEYKTDLYNTHASFDINRPKNTMSCPQLGADFMRG
jgi:hypothetical protein